MKHVLCAFLFLALPAFATISQRQSPVSQWNSSPTSSCYASLGSGYHSGDLIVVWTYWSTGSSSNNLTASVGDALGNSYVSAVGPTLQSASASNTAAQIFYVASTVVGSGPERVTVTYSGSATTSGCVFVEYQGADPNYPLDSVSAGYSYAPGILMDSGAVAPANANLLIFGGGTSDSGASLVNPPWTTVQSSGGSITEQQIISGNSALWRATAATPSGDWLMQMAIFRDASWTVGGGWSPVRNSQIVYADQFPGSDLGAKIQAADAALGAGIGQIWVAVSGNISESPVTLSSNHDLICVGDQTTLTMSSATAYIAQGSNTRIRNCTFYSAQSGMTGEIQASSVNNVEASNLTFTGTSSGSGGTHIYYSNVNYFRIENTRHTSLGAGAIAISVNSSSFGKLTGVRVEPMTLPSTDTFNGGLVWLLSSFNIDVIDGTISGVDASQTPGWGALGLDGSNNINIVGGQYTNNINMDGIVLEGGGSEAVPCRPGESGETTPSSDVTITGVVTTGNGNNTGIGRTHSHGDGIDIFNSQRVKISNSVIRNNGNYSGSGHNDVDAFFSSDILLSNNDLSDSGLIGVDVADTPNAVLRGNTINRANSSGVYAERVWVYCERTGTTVCLSKLNTNGYSFGLGWQKGTAIEINNGTNTTVYQIAQVINNKELMLESGTGSDPDSSTCTVQSYGLQIFGGTINDNGRGGGTGVSGAGIALDHGSVASIITGVTAGDTHPTGSKTQQYGLFINKQSTAVAYAFNNNFNGNNLGPVQDNYGQSTIENIVNEGSCSITAGTSCTGYFNNDYFTTPTSCSANSSQTTSGAVAVTGWSSSSVTFTVPTSGTYTIYYRCVGY